MPPLGISPTDVIGEVTEVVERGQTIGVGQAKAIRIDQNGTQFCCLPAAC